jgi:hypothetical protein
MLKVPLGLIVPPLIFSLPYALKAQNISAQGNALGKNK